MISQQTANDLNKLADFLETQILDDGFNLGLWYRQAPECGTVACACGWATTIPEFAERGLKLEKLSNFEKVVVLRDAGGYHSGFNAAMVFFGLERWQAKALFDPSGYPTPSMVRKSTVIAKIRAFLDSTGEFGTFI